MVQHMSINVLNGSIERLCDKQGISRNELARSIGVDPTTAYRIEKGRTRPSNYFIGALLSHVARHFGGQPEDHFIRFFEVTA